MRKVITFVMFAWTSGCAVGHHAVQPVRVLVLNMHAGKDAAGASNLDQVAALINSSGASLALLQEVDKGTRRSGGVDQPARLQELTGFQTAFGPSLIHYDGGQYGIAILSRGNLGYLSTVPLPVTPVQTRAGGSTEPRVALLVVAAVRGGLWSVLTTHLDPSDEKARLQEVGRVNELIHEQTAVGVPLIVGGDFNSTPESAAQAELRAAGLRDAWTECGQGDGFTYPADAPAKRIDYLFLTGDVHCSAAEVVDSRISDHRPLLITIR